MVETQRLQQGRDTVAWVGFPKESYARTTSQKRPPPRVRFRILLADVGWVERSVEFRPLSSAFEPEVLDCSSMPSQRVLGRARFSPATGEGVVQDREMLPRFVIEHGGSIPEWSLPGAWNQDVSVPIGKARIRFLDRVLSKVVDRQEVEVPDQGGTTPIHVRLPEGYVPVRLQPRDADGTLISSFSMTLHREPSSIESQMRSGDATLWLPRGDVAISIAADGFKMNHLRIAVESPGQVIKVRLEP
jgi:hypothetical protein